MLPKQKSVLYNLVVPSTGQKIKYRPFLVKEHKALMMAQQSEDMTVMIDTLKEIVKNCTVENIDLDKLAIFDLEYILVKIRAKSISEQVDLLFNCDDNPQHEKITVSIDLDTFEVTRDPAHEKKIPLFDNVGVMMKYPAIDIIINSVGDKEESAFDMAVRCIDYIYDEEEIFYAAEQTKEELLEFLDNLTEEQFKKVENFFVTMPKVEHSIEYICTACGKEHKKKIKGFSNFF